MTESMAEKVARALEPFFSSADIAYKEHVQAARAAIMATEEPTEAMVSAVTRTWAWGNFLYSDDWGDPVVKGDAVWKFMHQIALTEGTGE